MKEKNLIVLFVILAVLVGLVFVKKTMRKEVPTTEESVDIIAPAVNAAAVSEMSLMLISREPAESKGVSDGQVNEGQEAGEGDNTRRDFVSLVKEGERWKDMTQYGVDADETGIASALDMLDQLTGELRSNKANILGDYGIKEDQALNIKLKRNDGQIVHVLIGTETAGYQNSFVRLQDSNAVYMANQNLLAVFGARGEGAGQSLDTKKWADKRIAHLEVNDITGISIAQTVNGAQATVIDLRQATVDETKKWQSVLPYDFNLNANKIKQIAENLNNTYAREIIAPDTPGVFAAPGWVGTFTREGGETVAAIVVADLESKKEFSAVKKPPAPAAEAPSQGEAGAQEAAKEDVWESPAGESVDAAKVRDIINQISAFNLEAVPLPAASLANAMTLNITGEEGAKQYTVSKDVKLDNGK